MESGLKRCLGGRWPKRMTKEQNNIVAERLHTQVALHNTELFKYSCFCHAAQREYSPS